MFAIRQREEEEKKLFIDKETEQTTRIFRFLFLRLWFSCERNFSLLAAHRENFLDRMKLLGIWEWGCSQGKAGKTI